MNKNNKENKKMISGGELSQEMIKKVLESGLCENASLQMQGGQGGNQGGQSGGGMPQIGGQNSQMQGGMPQSGGGQNMQMPNFQCDGDIVSYIEKGRNSSSLCVESLLARVYDLVMQKNHLISVIEMLEGGGGSEVPPSTGSTRQTIQRRGFIPKSAVEQMSREEIREMFDLIDKSRKEW